MKKILIIMTIATIITNVSFATSKKNISKNNEEFSIIINEHKTPLGIETYLNTPEIPNIVLARNGIPTPVTMEFSVHNLDEWCTLYAIDSFGDLRPAAKKDLDSGKLIAYITEDFYYDNYLVAKLSCDRKKAEIGATAKIENISVSLTNSQGTKYDSKGTYSMEASFNPQLN